VPATTQANRFGISVGDTLPGLSQAELNARMDDFRALGVGWVRADLDWNDIQGSGPNTWDWSNYDRVVAAASARGLKVLPIIAYTAPWARPSGCNDEMCAPANVAAFANFAQQAVLRYAPRGIHVWEVWNEPNLNGFWKPSPNAAAFVNLLHATYPAIKQADSTATVISGGLASTDSSSGIPQLTYLQQMYSAGGRPYFDAVGYHPYSFPVPASYNASWNAWSKMGITNPSIRSIMVANGDSAKHIWATEYGAPTGGPGAGATASNYNLNAGPDHVDESLQAIIAADVVHVGNTYPWLSATFWYSYRDLGTSSSTSENFYGLLRYDGSRKPAYAALQQAIAASR
jgi:polysaccharide biosynthesis protein PslG